jgi:hypothetical protein
MGGGIGGIADAAAPVAALSGAWSRRSAWQPENVGAWR